MNISTELMKCSTVVVPVAGQREGPDTTPEKRFVVVTPLPLFQ